MLTNFGLHHFHRRVSSELHPFFESRSKLIKLFDRLVYIGGTSGVIVTLPQLTKIWIGRNVAGLSLITWIGLFCGTLFWVCCGVLHKARPIIFINLVYSVVNLLIVIGIIAFS
jgi:uncharacterized protein with PQ loop repeat